MVGKILRVDLTTGKIEKEPTSSYVKDYVGGAGIGARIFWEEVPPDTPAYDPANLLMFNTGSLTGTLLGNKCDVASKTPEQPNNPYVHVGLGGQIPSEIKYAGYDHIVIKGKAERPVYLFINNDDVHIRDSKHLWGLDTQETQARIKEELKDPDVQIACIGPAGENMVIGSLILHDIQNTAARGGFGALMGSKNLKAVAVRGTKGLKVADPKAFADLWKEYYGFYANGRGYAFLKGQSQGGIARHVYDGYRYQQRVVSGNFDPLMKDFLKGYMVGSIGCTFCPVQCQQNYSVPGIDNGGATCANYGMFPFLSHMVNAPDLKSWWKAISMAQRYGMESMAITTIAGWLMLLYQQGMITAADTDGMPMEWGSEKATLTVIDKVCRQEGFGKLFANGILSAAKVIAGGKGLPLVDWVSQSRNRPSFPLAGSVLWGFAATGKAGNYRTGDIEVHPYTFDYLANVELYSEVLEISFEEARKLIEEWASEHSEKWSGDRDVWREGVYDKKQAMLTIESEDIGLLCDITGHCEWPSERQCHFGCSGGFKEMAQWLSAAIGTSHTTDMLYVVAHRTRTLIDSYNALCQQLIGDQGTVSAEKAAEAQIPDPDVLAKLQMVGAEYCRLRGYDPETGVPTREQLEKLGLKDVAYKLESVLGSIPPG